MKIIRLNRLLLETIYPENAPKFIDYFYSAKVNYYSGPNSKEAFRDVFIDDIEKRYFLDYRVADMALQFEGIFDLMLIDYKTMIEQHGYNKYPSKFSQHIYHRAIMDIPLIIVGETGTGKELCARAIHLISKRRQSPFVEINCVAIPETLLESELFGVIANYPGLHNPEGLIGKIEQANGGIIFLDELGKMPKNLQAKFLKVVEEKKITALGSKETKNINVRFIAAVQPIDLNGDSLLPDLKYRLGYPDVIHMPTLNERINELGERLLSISLDKTIKKIGLINSELIIDSALIDALKNRTYEGNFRELESIYRMAIINAKAEATHHNNRSLKYDDFLAGKYVTRISNKNILGLNQVFVNDQHDPKIKNSDDIVENIPLRSIVKYAEKKASEIIEKRVSKILEEGKNIKDVLISEGISEKEYQNILGKITRHMGKGINELKKNAHPTP
jgi:DNA-binding NtrC family response regulator